MTFRSFEFAQKFAASRQYRAAESKISTCLMIVELPKFATVHARRATCTRHGRHKRFICFHLFLQGRPWFTGLSARTILLRVVELARDRTVPVSFRFEKGPNVPYTLEGSALVGPRSIHVQCAKCTCTDKDKDVPYV